MSKLHASMTQNAAQAIIQGYCIALAVLLLLVRIQNAWGQMEHCVLQLPQVLDAIQLSHATFNKIRQNLWWAFGYNLVGIPLAAGALLPSMGVALTPSISGQYAPSGFLLTCGACKVLSSPTQRMYKVKHMKHCQHDGTHTASTFNSSDRFLGIYE